MLLGCFPGHLACCGCVTLDSDSSQVLGGVLECW